MNAEVLKGRRGSPVIQFSIFAENKVGRLNDLMMLLATHQLHVIAICSLDTTDSTIIRVIVNYPEQARELFLQQGFTFNQVEVVVVEIDSEENLRHVTC